MVIFGGYDYRLCNVFMFSFLKIVVRLLRFLLFLSYLVLVFRLELLVVSVLIVIRLAAISIVGIRKATLLSLVQTDS